jgi:uncharacterized protein YcbX
VAALGAAFGDPELSERRFRSNIAVDNMSAWEELGWVGRTVQIGALTFSVVKEKVRCLATHANPITGERDRPVMTVLVERFGQDEPTMGIALVPAAGGGEIRLGDEVRLVES